MSNADARSCDSQDHVAWRSALAASRRGPSLTAIPPSMMDREKNYMLVFLIYIYICIYDMDISYGYMIWIYDMDI